MLPRIAFFSLFFTLDLGIHMEAIAKWLRELSIESEAYFCINLLIWFHL